MHSRIVGALGLVGKTAVRYAVGRARHGVADELDRKVDSLYKPYTRTGMLLTIGVSAAVALMTVAFSSVVAGIVLLIAQLADEPLHVAGLILLIGGAVLAILVITGMIVGIMSSWNAIRQASREVTQKIRGD